MSPEEKAKELFTTFHQYDWDEERGWMPNDTESKKMAGKVIDEIELQAENWGVTSVRAYWRSVRVALNAL